MELAVRSDQVALGLLQVGLDNLQGQRLGNRIVPLLGCCPEEEVFPSIQSEPLVSVVSLYFFFFF